MQNHCAQKLQFKVIFSKLTNNDHLNAMISKILVIILLAILTPITSQAL